MTQPGSSNARAPSPWGLWTRTPLYLRIVAGLVFGVITGLAFGASTAVLAVPSRLVLRMLGALAPGLIMVAIIKALLEAQLEPGTAPKLIRLLVINTLVAIFIGLLVANVLSPGSWTRDPRHPSASAAERSEQPGALGAQANAAARWTERQPKQPDNQASPPATPGARTEPQLRVPVPCCTLPSEEPAQQKAEAGAGSPTSVALSSSAAAETQVAPAAETTQTPENKAQPDILQQFLDNIPRSLLGPLGDDGKVLGVIFWALAFGVALRTRPHGSEVTLAQYPVSSFKDVVDLALTAFVVILHWVIEFVPFAVFGLVASIVGTQGFQPFLALGAFIIAVLVGLFLQTSYYLTRVRLGSWVRPLDLLRACRDALVMAFSTASSTVTMPVTYEALRDRVGLRERSASLGALVGSNFNNDGTALYEAMAALFVSQLLAAQGIGHALSLGQQLTVVITSVVASVGAAGIPEAGLVTMTMVFHAVQLPTEYIALLLPVDWFLDRCRTVINVMGDMAVSCLMDGKDRE